MNVTIRILVAVFVVACATQSSMAQGIGDPIIVTNVVGDGGITAVGGTVSTTDPAAIGGENGYTFDLTLDSESDILVIDATLEVLTGSVFNDSDPAHGGSDHTPPLPPLTALFPTLSADLWITTPGLTGAADAASLTAGETVAHFDSSDDGPQTGFHWASVTVIPDSDGLVSAVLDVTIQTANTPTPLFDDVFVSMTTVVPEPGSLGVIVTALLGSIAIVRRRRS